MIFYYFVRHEKEDGSGVLILHKGYTIADSIEQAILNVIETYEVPADSIHIEPRKVMPIV